MVSDMRSKWLVGVVVFLITLSIFWPATDYGFVGLDDEAYVSKNPMTSNGFSSESIKWAWTANVVGYWAPLLWKSYMLDSTLWGPRPQGFHRTNILLHGINAALLFILILRWTGRRYAACWGALFWALHPLRVESVAWIAERKGLLSGLFFLLCLLAYERARSEKHKDRFWYWTSVLCLMAGLLVKPVLVTVPFVLLLLDFWPLQRLSFDWLELRRKLPKLVLEKWPFWLLALGFGMAHWRVNVIAGIPHAEMPSLLERAWLVPGNYWVYLRQTVWPGTLSVLYERPAHSPPVVIFALMLLGGITILTWKYRSAAPACLVGWLWFLGMLVPSIGFIWMGTTEGLGDRFAYLPGIGLVIMVLSAVPNGVRFQRVIFTAGVLSLTFAAVFTARQLPVWKNAGSLFGRVLSMQPDHLQANLNYGVWLYEQGDKERAIEHFRRAIRAGGSAGTVIGETGYSWVLQGKTSKARAMLWPALFERGTTPLIHGAYGMAALHDTEYETAIRHLLLALQMTPDDYEFRVEKIRALFEVGDEERALEQASFLTGRPGVEIQQYADLFGFYLHRWRSGARAYAWRYFERLVEVVPNSVLLLNNLAWLAATDGDAPPEAVAASSALARRALDTAGTEHPSLLDTLAASLAAIGQYEDAVQVADRAFQIAVDEGMSELAAAIERRAESYRQQKQWRE